MARTRLSRGHGDFRADICPVFPESYTLEEKHQICDDMIATSTAILDAMRADFDTYPPDIHAKLLDALWNSATESPEWWWNVLVGDGDTPYT